MGLVDHAQAELARIRGQNDGDDDIGAWFEEAILGVVRAFAEGGHSGGTAAEAIPIIEKLLRFEPITPLTGEDSEWFDPMPEEAELLMNVRCSRVMKRKSDGVAFDVDGVIFEGPDGSRWTGSDSMVPVTFPYTPTTRIVQRPALDEQEASR